MAAVLMRKLLLSILFTPILTHALSQQRISVAGGVHQSSISPYWALQPGATSQIMQKRSSVHIGVVADMPIARFSHWYFQTGVLYAARGGKQQQAFDDSITKFTLYTYSQDINYIDLPMNFIYKFPSPGNTRFIIGAGPLASMLLSGSTSSSFLETSGDFIMEVNRDLPVGKGNEQFRLIYWGLNIFAGFEFGKAYLAANYSKGFNSYYQQGNHQYKHSTIGITLGIFLNEPKEQDRRAFDGVYECPEWW
jgi:OmpA-OmpF porin, OOP family